METKGCHSVAQMALTAKETILLPQHVGQMAGLLYLHSGSATLIGTSGPPLSVGAGAAAVYPAWHPYWLTAQEDASVLICVFLCDQVENVSARLAMAPNLPTQLDALLRTIEQARREAAAGGLLERLTVQPSSEPGDIPLYVQAAHRIIHTCYGEDLTLEELAARVGRSKFHLSHAFRDCYHVTPGAYLTSVRLTHAEELLADTDLTVREIGKQVGFPNSAYFTSLFKQHFGCTPKEYRTFRKSTS